VTFSYNAADLTSTDATTKGRARIRLRIGDTEAAGHLLENEEIDAYLADHPDGSGYFDLPLVALKCGRLMLARLQKVTDLNGAGISTSRSQKFFQMKDLLLELEKETLGGLDLTVTGTIADKDAIEADTSRTPPVFSLGWDRNTGTRQG